MSAYSKADVFIKHPKIRPYIETDDIFIRVKQDLDIHDDDNLVLLTYKFVLDNKNSDITNYKIYPNDVKSCFKKIMVEFNESLGKINRADYFKMMATAEIKDYNNREYCDSTFNSSCILYVIVNIGNLDMDTLRKVFSQKSNGWFNNVEFDSVFVQDKIINGKKYNKPFKNRMYIEPISNKCSVIDQINDIYHNEHFGVDWDLMDENTGEFFPTKPEYFDKWPVWWIMGINDNTIQYARESGWFELYKKINQKPNDYDVYPEMEDKYDSLGYIIHNL